MEGCYCQKAIKLPGSEHNVEELIICRAFYPLSLETTPHTPFRKLKLPENACPTPRWRGKGDYKIWSCDITLRCYLCSKTSITLTTETLG